MSFLKQPFVRLAIWCGFLSSSLLGVILVKLHLDPFGFVAVGGLCAGLVLSGVLLKAGLDDWRLAKRRRPDGKFGKP